MQAFLGQGFVTTAGSSVLPDPNPADTAASVTSDLLRAARLGNLVDQSPAASCCGIHRDKPLFPPPPSFPPALPTPGSRTGLTGMLPRGSSGAAICPSTAAAHLRIIGRTWACMALRVMLVAEPASRLGLHQPRADMQAGERLRVDFVGIQPRALLRRDEDCFARQWRRASTPPAGGKPFGPAGQS